MTLAVINDLWLNFKNVECTRWKRAMHVIVTEATIQIKGLHSHQNIYSVTI